MDSSGISNADELLNLSLDALEGTLPRPFEEFLAELDPSSRDEMRRMVEDGLRQIESGRVVSGEEAMARARAIVRERAER
jgi:hypothetical protein